MAWNEAYAQSNSVVVNADGLEVVTSPVRYSPKSGDLTVYYNGLYAVLDKDYIEVSPYSIKFLYPLNKDDVVSFHVQKLW